MGRRKRKKIVYRPVKTPPKVFTCPKCGHKTMKAKMKFKDDQALIKCGHCGIEQTVLKNQLTEPVDAFGDFIDIYYKDQEYERLTTRADKLEQKGQYTELTLVYSFLSDIASINSDKFMEEYEVNKDPEDLSLAETWADTAKEYKRLEQDLKHNLDTGIIKDAELEDQIYEDEEDNPFDEGEAKVSEKPKKGTNLEDVLDDIGFLEF